VHNDTQLQAREPYVSAKELDTSAKEPYISAKEPYISAKEPYISTKEELRKVHEDKCLKILKSQLAPQLTRKKEND